MGPTLRPEIASPAPPTHRASRIRRLGPVVAIAVAALAASALFAPAASAEASVSVSRQSIEVTNFPVSLANCVNAGNGELVLVSGTLHTTNVIRNDANGGLHVTLHANLAGMSGVGTSSGDLYRITDTAGGSGGRVSLYVPAGSPPRTLTQSFDTRIISMGSGDNLVIRNTFHLTIDANGDVTVNNPTFEPRCIG